MGGDPGGRGEHDVEAGIALAAGRRWAPGDPVREDGGKRGKQAARLRGSGSPVPSGPGAGGDRRTRHRGQVRSAAGSGHRRVPVWQRPAGNGGIRPGCGPGAPLRQAAPSGRRSADPGLLAAVLPARHLALAGPDWPLERLALADQALGLARSAPAPIQELWARVWRTDAFWELGDIASADAEIERLAGLAHTLRNPVARWHLQRCQAVRALRLGRYEQAVALSEEATAVLPPENFIARFLHFAFMSSVDADRGESTWLDAHREMFDVGPSVIVRSMLASCFLSAGQRDEALPYYEQARGSLRRVPRDARWMGTMGFLTHGAFQFDDRETAEICYRELLPFEGRFMASGGGSVVCQGSVALFLGMAAITLGRLDDSEEHLRRAIQRNAAAGARPWSSRAELVLAELLRRQGRARGQARDLAQRAARTATALGMRVLRARAEAVISDLTTPTAPVLLSRREREVAVLVARGLTNREIARTLFVSERTAENHVQHILAKLGFGSRAQIAAWAVSEGLSSAEN